MVLVKKIASYFPKTKADLKNSLIVFAAYFIAAQISLYIYYTFDTSPALIWPPIGIALAAFILYGYRIWASVFVAQFINLAIRDTFPISFSFVVAISYVLQIVISLYVLRRFNFKKIELDFKSILLLITIGILGTTIEPALVTVYRIYFGQFDVAPIVSFARTWGGGVFSVLIFTPLILFWQKQKRTFSLKVGDAIELFFAYSALVIVNYLLFWTAYLRDIGVIVIFFLPAVLIWFALRFHPRWLTLALVLASSVGVAGAILENPAEVHVSEQLLSIEIYIGLIAAIYLVFVSVVDERRNEHLKLTEAYSKLAEADKNKERFIAILGHELRNPLAPAINSVQLLKMKELSNDNLDIVENIEKHLSMMHRLLDDLLDTVRLSENRFKIHTKNVSLHEILEHSIASVQDIMTNRKHDFNISIPKEDLILNLDPTRTKQVIINLLNNAAKYTEPGGVIYLNCFKKGDYLYISVKDNGIGMTPKQIKDLFKPFKQFSQSEETERGTGLGIGLFLTKKLVDLQGGKIKIKSKGLGKGSEFIVSLPIIIGEQEVEKQRLKKIPSKQKINDTLKIVVVDDNKDASLTLSKLLSKDGFKVEVLNSGQEAVSKVPLLNPDLVLMDIEMPGMNGYETVERLRSIGWRGTIAALSGYGQEENKQKALSTGFDYYLVKPITLDTVRKLIKQLIEK